MSFSKSKLGLTHEQSAAARAPEPKIQPIPLTAKQPILLHKTVL